MIGRIAARIGISIVGVIERNNVYVRGSGERAMVFAHGFGCDQNMWRFVEPAFEDDFRTVLFDHVGAGGSDLKAYDKAKYSTLGGYANDVVEIGRELGLKDAVFVGHSLGAMSGSAVRSVPVDWQGPVANGVGSIPGTITPATTGPVLMPMRRLKVSPLGASCSAISCCSPSAASAMAWAWSERGTGTPAATM